MEPKNTDTESTAETPAVGCSDLLALSLHEECIDCYALEKPDRIPICTLGYEIKKTPYQMGLLKQVHNFIDITPTEPCPKPMTHEAWDRAASILANVQIDTSTPEKTS